MQQLIGIGIWVVIISAICAVLNWVDTNEKLRKQINALRQQMNLEIAETQRLSSAKLESRPEVAKRADDLLDQAITCASAETSSLAQQKANMELSITLITRARAIIDGSTPQ